MPRWIAYSVPERKNTLMDLCGTAAVQENRLLTQSINAVWLFKVLMSKSSISIAGVLPSWLATCDMISAALVRLVSKVIYCFNSSLTS